MFLKAIKDLFKKYFIAGTVVIVPIAVTLWILKSIIEWADGFFISLLPDFFKPSFLSFDRIPGAGLVLTVGIILLVGVITRLYLGKKLIAFGDSLLNRLPFGRSIYNALKQILQTAFTSQEDKFKGVALVEYPKEGSFAIAFITGDVDADISPDINEKYLKVFVPTSPNPTSGFLLIVPERKLKRLNMSVEEASKLVISGGLL
ncbi:MAG: hypothetical protein COV46_00675 [Deltaproteobacteria bacterium CG11_big_fil_rev_8_21_14_0_20_49_13]|nr:MAG: hypothetical protein COV46_00675 [Deltaproteobacteria bacterium CG11_big_fil_rev_8_21_14_0_20_49_13]